MTEREWRVRPPQDKTPKSKKVPRKEPNRQRICCGAEQSPPVVVNSTPLSRGVGVNVVVVSNRVARAKPDEPLAGGLAAALLPMVRDSGAIWVGSSGQETDTTQTHDSFAKIEALGSGALATVDMPAQHYRGYYEGFANSALWPALHSRPDLIHVTTEDYESY